MTDWERIGKDDVEAVYRFLLEREYACVTLTSRLKDAGFPHSGFGKIRGLLKIRRGSTETPIVSDVIYEGQYGLVVPVLDMSGYDRAEYRSDIDALYKRETPFLFSVIGLKRDVQILEHAFERKPLKTINYFLMTADDNVSAESIRDVGGYPGLRFHTAGVQDASALFPLQKEYEKEEVLLDPSKFDADSSMSQLRETIQDGMVVFAEIDGKPVAKAGTNAIGYTYAQIGGVYTEKSLRNGHIGFKLMKYLLGLFSQAGYKPCLFVKYENSPAISLYRRLGFIIRDDFRISYYS